jgi:succinyl-CoA synthetase alpha subunit
VSIFVDESTRVVYQGLTGSQGRFYGLRNREYGTNVVAGTNPKKAGTDVDGIPVFATVKDAVAETGANASCVFIPAPGVSDAVLEAGEGGIAIVVVITEGVPITPARACSAPTARALSRRGSATSGSPPERSPWVAARWAS